MARARIQPPEPLPLRRRGKHVGPVPLSIFEGAARCAKCGDLLSTTRSSKGNHLYLLCSTKKKLGAAACGSVRVRYDYALDAFLGGGAIMCRERPTYGKGRAIDAELERLKGLPDDPKAQAAARRLMDKRRQHREQTQIGTAAARLEKKLQEAARSGSALSGDRRRTLNLYVRAAFSQITFVDGEARFKWKSKFGGESTLRYGAPVSPQKSEAVLD